MAESIHEIINISTFSKNIVTIVKLTMIFNIITFNIKYKHYEHHSISPLFILCQGGSKNKILLIRMNLTTSLNSKQESVPQNNTF